MDTLINLLTYALPGGFVGSVFAWFAGRRERNNDMLAKLQASINLLSDENRKILAENVQLRRENATLQAKQEELLQSQAALLREVDRLRMEISKLTKLENGTNNKFDNTHGGDYRNPHVSAGVRKLQPELPQGGNHTGNPFGGLRHGGAGIRDSTDNDEGRRQRDCDIEASQSEGGSAGSGIEYDHSDAEPP